MFQAEILQKTASHAKIRINEPMALHTTFRIGGPARIYIEPYYIEDLVNVIKYLRKEDEKYFIIGNGSNILVNDMGYNGIIISTRGTSDKELGQNYIEDGICTPLDIVKVYDNDEKYDSEEKEEDRTVVYAGCGVLLSKLAVTAAENGLKGFEFAGGIPGTLGGAITMNAGAYGGEIKDAIIDARVITQEGEVLTLKKEELELSYRSSIIQKQDMVVLDAHFAFKRGNKEEILSYMQELNRKRRQKQPLEYGSAGSTFKRPDGYFAGKLIQDAGLKGYRCGDIMVSDKHSGFVVNTGNGTYEQAMQVINHVQEKVKAKFGVDLELEVRLL